MAELLSRAKSRLGPADSNGASRHAEPMKAGEAGKTGDLHAFDRAKRVGTLSYLERSTMRRETGIAGTAGHSGIASGAGSTIRPFARSLAPSTPRQRKKTDGRYDTGEPARARLKPHKLYDKKAASIAKTVAERDRLASKNRAKHLGDNAKLAIAFILLVALGTGLYFSVPEVTRVNKVTVLGMTNTTEKEIMEALNLTPDINLVNADVPAMEGRILANPKIAEANVRRVFPDQLAIDLVERKAVACVLINEEIGTKSVAIDADGVAFAFMDSIASSGKLPVLSGIRFERFLPGQRLPEYLRPLLGDIAGLSKDSPSLLEAFSEIKIEKISDSEAELLLFPSGKSVPIRMSARLTKASLGSALLVLDILAGRQGTEKIEEIDFRTGTIVYRTKEAQAD